jgi:hypothetical protein
MTAKQEVRWEYDAVEVGQTGPEVTIDVTDALVSQYASTVRNDNPAYHAGPEPSGNGGKLAMPTMLLRVAPLRRHEIAANNGFVALERASENPRQTPFAKCEIRWFAPVRADDSITSFGRILEKYERRGNKFVTFRVEARNQHSQKVAEYDYTCIFEYARGQKKSDS